MLRFSMRYMHCVPDRLQIGSFVNVRPSLSALMHSDLSKESLHGSVLHQQPFSAANVSCVHFRNAFVSANTLNDILENSSPSGGMDHSGILYDKQTVNCQHVQMLCSNIINHIIRINTAIMKFKQVSWPKFDFV